MDTNLTQQKTKLQEIHSAKISSYKVDERKEDYLIENFSNRSFTFTNYIYNLFDDIFFNLDEIFLKEIIFFLTNMILLPGNPLQSLIIFIVNPI